MKAYRKLARVAHVHTLINAGMYDMAGIVRRSAEKFEHCSQSTIEKIIQQLREEFDAPIKYSHKRSAYYYTEPFNFKQIILDQLGL